MRRCVCELLGPRRVRTGSERVTSDAIGEAGWRVLSVEEECCEVSEDWYSEDEEGREYYQQAISEGNCYVFYQWPVEPQEGDDVH